MEGFSNINVDRLIKSGPNRVIISEDGNAVSPKIARDSKSIVSEIIFVRDDGWSLGANAQLQHSAFDIWKDKWIAFIDVPNRIMLPIAEYHKIE
jgi:hypothetical protein